MPNTTEDSAVLRVVVTTALGALPLADASVTVSTAAWSNSCDASASVSAKMRRT